MIEVKAAIEIDAGSDAIWKYLIHFEDWWIRSNPKEHIELTLLDTKEIKKGAKFILKESIAGITGSAIAEVTDLVPMKKLVWTSHNAKYNLIGINITANEGGIFELEEIDSRCRLSHHVWGTIEIPFIGGAMEWIFKHVLNGEKKDYDHTYRELKFVKYEIESGKS